jgi:hypothetical protein
MNVPINITKVVGKEGRVKMPDLGAVVGWFSSWELTKAKPLDSTYIFRATFGHVNKVLWDQDKYRRVITIDLSKSKTYQLAGGGEPTISGTTLTIEGVSLCLPEEGSKP